MQLCEAEAATHFLESQGQALSAGSKSSSPQNPLTHWRAKDRHCQHGQNPAHHRTHSHTGEPRTGIISRVKIQLTTEPTHQLESQGQVSSAGSKSSSPQNPLTSWRAKDRHRQQGQNPAHHRTHSHPGEPRTGIISRVKIQLTTEPTHQLESQGQALSAGSKSSLPRNPLTGWGAKDMHHQQGQNPAHHRTHSHTGEPRTCIISRVKIQLTTEPTHILESQGQALSAGSKSSSPQNPLTDWRAKDRHNQQSQNPAHHRTHSHPEEPRTGVVSRVKIQLTTEPTHILESRGQVLSAGSKSSSPRNPLTFWRAKDRCHQQGSKSSSPQNPLTFWRAKDRHCQQGQNPAHHETHSHSGEPRTGIVSRVKSSSPQNPLTSWRAEDRCCQHGQNPAHHRTHSPTGEPRTCIISRVKIQLTTEPTHRLESQGQASSAGSKSSSPQNPLTN